MNSDKVVIIPQWCSVKHIPKEGDKLDSERVIQINMELVELIEVRLDKDNGKNK